MSTRHACAPGFVFLLTALALGPVHGQAPPSTPLKAILSEEILSPSTSLIQMRRYLLSRVARPPEPTNAEAWTRESGQLRQHLLDNVVFHGWPREIVQAPPRFEDFGVIETGKGYRIRKLRYEIIPGFVSAALLYEPEPAASPIPAILNVNGHVGAPGKAVDYKQKRCIHFAKNGILALNLEWLACGELAQKENQHWYGAHLDLVGRHELGLFYLAMRRGLDYLWNHPLTDRDRVGMTGLSGGGWQTIVLAALDERVNVAVPVAGFSSVVPRIEVHQYGDLGDVEQSATDLLAGRDYVHLLALRAPRPTLLIYNAQDDCCFRASLVKPLTYEGARPLFRLHGREDALGWHENLDPGTHNYEWENRVEAYRFFGRHFKLPPMTNEIIEANEIRPVRDLSVGLPTNNLSILRLAQDLGRKIQRAPAPADAAEHSAWVATTRAKLATTLRYQPVQIARPWAVAATKSQGIETVSFLFEMSDGLCANGVWARSYECPTHAPVTLMLHDQGKSALAADVSSRIRQGEQVLALDLLWIGDAWRGLPAAGYAQFVHALGERGIGLVVAQLSAIARWSRIRADVDRLRIETTGLRSQTAALVACALQPGCVSEITVRDGLGSLSYLLEKPVGFAEAPELFCLDLLLESDLDGLEKLAQGTRVHTLNSIDRNR